MDGSTESRGFSPVRAGADRKEMLTLTRDGPHCIQIQVAHHDRIIKASVTSAVQPMNGLKLQSD